MNDGSFKAGSIDEIATFFRRLQWALLLLGVGALAMMLRRQRIG